MRVVGWGGNQVTDDSDTLTPKEAGEILKLKPDTIVRLIRSGKMPGFAIGNGTKRHRWLVRRSDVMAYLYDHQYVPESGVAQQPKPRTQRVSYPILEKFGGVSY